MTSRTTVFIFLASFIAASCSSLDSYDDNTARYVNDEFGLSVEFDNKYIVCRVESGSHPLGFYTVFGDNFGNCRSERNLRQSRGISVQGSYNANLSKSPEEAVEFVCRGARGRFSSATQLTFPGRRSHNCRVVLPDGTIRIVVSAQGDDVYEEGVSRINYTAYLETTEYYADVDVDRLIEILGSVKISSASD